MREWRNRQTRTVQVRVPVMEWGFNSPLAHDETADPSRVCGFRFPWLWRRCHRTDFLMLLVVPRVFSGCWTWTGACGSASAGGSWSALASPGPATGSSCPSAGLRVSWRPGRAAGCRSGPAGARGDHASRGQARAARAAAGQLDIRSTAAV